jgi:hypothetical protein
MMDVVVDQYTAEAVAAMANGESWLEATVNGEVHFAPSAHVATVPVVPT